MGFNKIIKITKWLSLVIALFIRIAFKGKFLFIIYSLIFFRVGLEIYTTFKEKDVKKRIKRIRKIVISVPIIIFLGFLLKHYHILY